MERKKTFEIIVEKLYCTNLLYSYIIIIIIAITIFINGEYTDAILCEW